MDLVGEMLGKYLERDHAGAFAATRLSPPFRKRFTRLRPASRQFFNADRILNRFWEYQRWVQPRLADFDLFHVVDHSYSQLLHKLPAQKTIVSCHDLDTFRCLLQPEAEPRSKLFREMMQYVLKGFRKAALITCDSAAIRDELLRHKLAEPDRVRVIPLGVHPSCSPEPNPGADAEAAALIKTSLNAINLLHVGSTIPRKRIDVLLKVFANVRRDFPEVRLLRVGGPFTEAQSQLVEKLNLKDAIVVLPYVSRDVLAAIYRQSDLVLQPSESEGFGLPVIEAMACGTPVLASNLPVLREVGGAVVSYAPVADISAWAETLKDLLREQAHDPDKWFVRRNSGLKQALKFSWARYAQNMAALYQEVLA
jgi:glycosyltransferase involved in cell wall biosynthesis